MVVALVSGQDVCCDFTGRFALGKLQCSRNVKCDVLRQGGQVVAKAGRKLNLDGFLEGLSVAWRGGKDRLQGGDIHRLPVLLHKGGRKLQYVWDGKRLWTVDLEYQSRRNSGRGLGDWFEDRVAQIGRALHSTFVPDQVRPQYMMYLRWKVIHRFFSSLLHVQCTQAMLRAVGVGAWRALPSAAALNWVLKDGLGRLGKLTYTASLGHTFDSNLKRVRFSTSVLFCLSLGLEILTSVFPRHFLILATLANVGKSISFAAYLATSSAIHKSFALADNLADISAKGQAQNVVADNLGLAVAVCISHFCRYHPRIENMLPVVIFPVLSLLDLFAIYHQLQAVHLQTLNKERLEIIADQWVSNCRVPSVEEVSKVEGQSLLRPYGGGNRRLPLRIGALPLRFGTPQYLMSTIDCQKTQRYTLCSEPFFSLPWLGHRSLSQPGLLIWLHESAVAEDIIKAVLQASYVRFLITRGVSQTGERYQEEAISGQWQDLLRESLRHAEAGVRSLLAAMEKEGWHAKHVLLSPHEQSRYSTLQI